MRQSLYGMLRVKIDITSRGKKGYTALHYAAQNGHLEIWKLILEYGAVNPAELNAYGDTATMLAVESGKHAAVTLLLKDKRVKPLQRNKKGVPLLHLATLRNSKLTLELLLNDGRFDPNILQYAEGCKHVVVAKRIRAHLGLQLDKLTFEGNTSSIKLTF
jgi:ankyrin repeat protein